MSISAKEKLISSKAVFSGKAVRLKVDTIEKENGVITSREIVEHDDCVAVVALDDAENVIMVRQFRRPAGQNMLEIPAGGVEKGETPENCVVRELQEEIGYAPRKLEKLCGFFAAPGYCTEYMHVYVAADLVPSSLIAEDTDEIEIVRVPLASVIGMIKNGEIHDAKSIASLLAFITQLEC
jgi:ADP-ribose pyrophosphatase